MRGQEDVGNFFPSKRLVSRVINQPRVSCHCTTCYNQRKREGGSTVFKYAKDLDAQSIVLADTPIQTSI